MKLFKVFVMINVQLILFLVERVFSFKGYLHYKTITSQNVLSEVSLRSILFCRKVMLHVLDVPVFIFFNRLICYQICDVMKSINTWYRVRFWIYLLNYNSLTHFSPVSHFYTPWKRQKTFGFLTFSGAIEMWHCTKMG